MVVDTSEICQNAMVQRCRALDLPSRAANPVVVISFASPSPADRTQVITGKRVAASTPDRSRLVAIQIEADQMGREPMTPRGARRVDVQAVSARWE